MCAPDQTWLPQHQRPSRSRRSPGHGFRRWSGSLATPSGHRTPRGSPYRWPGTAHPEPFAFRAGRTCVHPDGRPSGGGCGPPSRIHRNYVQPGWIEYGKCNFLVTSAENSGGKQRKCGTIAYRPGFGLTAHHLDELIG